SRDARRGSRAIATLARASRGRASVGTVTPHPFSTKVGSNKDHPAGWSLLHLASLLCDPSFPSFRPTGPTRPTCLPHTLRVYSYADSLLTLSRRAAFLPASRAN